MSLVELPPPSNDIDEALNEEQLINIQINAHSVKEVLSELSVRLETAHQQISTLQDRKEINDINERMDKLQEQIESVASQSSRRINNAPQSMEEVTQEINKIILPVKENFQKLLDELHNLINSENLKLLEEKLDLFRKENIDFLGKEYTSISQHNSLLAHIQTLYDKISDLSRSQAQPAIIQKEVYIDNQKQLADTIPTDLLEQLKSIQEKIENLENKSNNDKCISDLQKGFYEIKEKVGEQDEEIKECINTLFLLGQKFNQYQNEIEGRINKIELDNLNIQSQSRTDGDQSQSSDQPNILSKIIPIISNLQEKQLQLETKVQEQNDLIQSLQSNQNKSALQKPSVTFVIEETNSHQIAQNTDIEEKLDNPLSSGSRDLYSRPLENATVEGQRSPNQILSLQSTPRDHQSFKELSRHLNENDLRVTDLENEVIIIKSTLKEINQNEINPNSDIISEMKLALDQKHAEQSQIVLSAFSSSRQSTLQLSFDQNELSKDIQESKISDQTNNSNSQQNELSKDNNSNSQQNELSKDNNSNNQQISYKPNYIDDISINDFGNLSKEVQSLMIRVRNLESRTSAKFATSTDETLPNSEEIKSKNSESNISKTKQKHVQFSSTSVQTFEDTEIQVVITSDTATSPSTITPNASSRNENSDNYQSILNINNNNNDGRLDSSRMESEPESNENKAKKVELRISTPINEDISASRTPNSLTPSSSSRDKSKQILNDHYIELINRMSNSLNETIQTVASLSDAVNTMDNKLESFISDQQSKLSDDQSKSNFNTDEFTTSIINQVRFEIDQRLMGLTPQVVQDLNNFATIGVVKSIAQNFQVSVDDIDHQISQIKEFLNSLVTRNDLDAVLDKINTSNNRAGDGTGATDTAAGTFKIRCLLCGRAAAGVTGMIAESEVAKLLGTPPISFAKKGNTRNSFDSSKMVLTYAKDSMKQKNMKKMKVATLPPMEEQSKSLNKTNETS